MSLWTVAWIGWLLVFLLIEIPAVLNRGHGDTLSEHLWWFIGKGQPRTPAVHLRRLVLLFFTIWLVVHVFTGWV